MGNAACGECGVSVPERKLKEVPPRGSQKWVCGECFRRLTKQEEGSAVAEAQNMLKEEMTKKTEEAKGDGA